MITLSIDSLKKQNSKLILIVGQNSSGKTKALQELSNNGIYPRVNLNLEISEILSKSLEIEPDWEKLLEKLINSYQSDILLFDNAELLFTKDFNIDPIRLLKSQNRKKVIIMAWNGEYNGTTLTYGNPGDEDYRKFSSNDLDGIEIIKISDLR